ncbi:MAG: AAA family ATPase [Acinetobacter populi]|jgi:chromosome segregation protein|uniref:AAA family ATPase n=1 Tax=Acinetobacter populi TaxID=1582270 RepID=UPI0023569437|nr:AAA family ATPase [Acinetobacter populi]MCH4248362.1 AAA family ATPase [Acinetobacter populi]
MRLSSLKLVGFKSFAESTTLHFKDNRSAIVGPNGCGKSNVIDAIRWVMGESSAKQLRGGNMQDVIFAGTSQRKPVGVASVELRFENTYGKLGGAYNAYSELSVKRQVNREGKSEYFLNGTRCRRKDITDIFLGTGLGPRSYAVIEQGMINRLVDAKPEEMRVFIEEAAGISRYQARRRETLQHLEHTQSNLSRLNDIALELNSQIKTLKRQAEQAEKYQKLKQEIVSYKIQLLSQQYIQALSQVERLTKQLTELTEQYQQQHKALEQIEIEGHLLQQKIQQQLPQAEVLQQNWQQAQQQHQQVLWQLQQDQAQQAQISQNIQGFEQQHQVLQDEHVKIAQELEQLSAQMIASQQQLQDVEQIQKESEQDLNALNSRFTQQEQEFNKEQQYLNQLQQQQKQLHYQLEQMQKTGLRSEQLLQQLQAQQQRHQNDDTAMQLDDLNIELANIQIKLEQSQQSEQQLSQQLQHHQVQKDELQQQCQELVMTEKNLQREIEQTEKLLGHLQQGQGVVAKQPLLQQLQLTYQGQQYSHLIERILAKWLFAETSDQIDWTYQGARQLQCDNIQMQEDQSGNVALIDLPTIETWIKAPLHRLWQSIYIAQDLEQAKQYLGQLDAISSIITEDGYWLATDWWINLNLDDQVSGDDAKNQTGQAQGQLHYHTHLKALQQQLEQVVTQKQPAQQQLAALQSQHQQSKDALQQMQQHLKQQQQQQQKLLTEQVRLQAILAQHEQNLLQLKQQAQQLQSQIAEDGQEQEQLQYDIVSLQLKIDQIQPQVMAKQEQFEQNKIRLNELKQQAQQDQQQVYQLHSQLQQQQSRHALLQQEDQFREQKIEHISEQLLDCRQQLQRLTDRMQEATEKEQLAKTQADQQQQLWLDWQQQIEQLQQQQQGFNAQRITLQQQENALRDQLEQTRLDWQQHKAEQHHVLEQLQQLGQPKPIEQQIDTVQVSRALEKAEQQFAKIGAINLAAFEELQLLQGRYDELDHQIQDLQQTIEQLQEAMKAIDQETKQLFMKTFDLVNRELQELFPKVFTGGEASLSLEDGWQSGVRLMARPPGKRNSTLALLSGGEKTLTALALVFAIFRLNPAPFCVLDEVDAPLDDANVNRFCNLVKELSQQVQFIYITHNKLAMTMATDLLGVTMPEAGSSKLVAVSLEQAEAYGMTME